jgi:acetylornithine deacetylase/succinyl-diaminopimelate desuccinylase-like protein
MLTIALVAATLAAAPADTALRFAQSVARDGPRLTAGPGERRAQERVAARFRQAGLAVAVQGFRVPGKGRSRNTIGIWDGPRRCLRILMAHSDSVRGTQGAVDNASGLGALAALAGRIPKLRPPCDVWLVATGAEERVYTGSPDHLGSRALAGRAEGRPLRYALSLDEVGAAGGLVLRSPVPGPRAAVEAELQAAARRTGVTLPWVRDSGSGNSDHREFQLAGMRGVVMANRTYSCWHKGCDTADKLSRLTFARVLRVVEDVVVRP